MPDPAHDPRAHCCRGRAYGAHPAHPTRGAARSRRGARVRRPLIAALTVRPREKMTHNEVLQIRRDELTSPVAASLIRALNAELAATYPEPGANHFRLDAEEVAEGRGVFLVAWA